MSMLRDARGTRGGKESISLHQPSLEQRNQDMKERGIPLKHEGPSNNLGNAAKMFYIRSGLEFRSDVAAKGKQSFARPTRRKVSH